MYSTQGLDVMHIKGAPSPITGIRWRFWDRSHAVQVGLIEERIARAYQSHTQFENNAQNPQTPGLATSRCLDPLLPCINIFLQVLFGNLRITLEILKILQDMARPCCAAWLPSGCVSTLVLLASALQSLKSKTWKQVKTKAWELKTKAQALPQWSIFFSACSVSCSKMILCPTISV